MLKRHKIYAKSIRFRRWSRKNYAVFAGLNKVISIGRVSAGISDMAILKTNSLSVASAVFSDDSLKINDEEDETESLLFENVLQPNIQILAADIPVCGLNQYYLLTQSWNGVKSLFPTFLF